MLSTVTITSMWDSKCVPGMLKCKEEEEGRGNQQQ